MSNLSLLESDRLAACERSIERGLKTFVEVGEALLEIRDSRLYRVAHPTFETYCRDRWGFDRRHANRLIDAAEIAETLGSIDPRLVPANLAQVRELAPLRGSSPSELAEVVQGAARGGPLTARALREAVSRRTPPREEIIPAGRLAVIALLELMAAFHGFVGTHSPEAVSREIEGRDRVALYEELNALIDRFTTIRDALRLPALSVMQ